MRRASLIAGLALLPLGWSLSRWGMTGHMAAHMIAVAVAAQALALQMDQLERKLRLKALRAQRLELYSLSRHHQIGDDVLREVLADLDMSEANLGTQK